MAYRRLAALLFPVLGVGACSLVQDIGSYSSRYDASARVPDSGSTCAADEKLCGETCVSTRDPAYGCGSDSCSACSAVHGTSKCTDDAVPTCGIDSCETGFDNCNGSADDGCEAQLSSNASHCGKCNKSCEGSTCGESRCQPLVLASAQSSPGEIALDDNNVFWTNYGGGTVMRSSKDAKSLVVLSEGQTNAWGIAVEGGQVIWANSQSPGSVWQAAANGSSSPAQLFSGGSRMRGVAADPTYAWICHYESNAFLRITRSDKLVVSFAAKKPNAVAIDETYAYFTNEDTGGGTNAGTVARVERTATTGTVPTTLLSNLNRPRGIAVDTNGVFVVATGNSSASDGVIYRIPKDGTTAVIIADGLRNPRELAIDDRYVYFATYGDGTIQRVLKDSAPGGTRETLATGQASPLGIAVDSKYVYWTNYATGNQGTVVRATKP